MAKPRKHRDGDPDLDAISSTDTLTPEQGRGEDSSPEPDRISQRAYELFQARGGADGSDWEDWLEAERELRKDRQGDTGE